MVFPFARRQRLYTHVLQIIWCIFLTIFLESQRASCRPSTLVKAVGYQSMHLRKIIHKTFPTWKKWSCQSFTTLSSSTESWVLTNPSIHFLALLELFRHNPTLCMTAHTCPCIGHGLELPIKVSYLKTLNDQFDLIICLWICFQWLFATGIMKIWAMFGWALFMILLLTFLPTFLFGSFSWAFFRSRHLLLHYRNLLLMDLR